jgi:DNA-directed RNA polymerase specialized sigma24 family protein
VNTPKLVSRVEWADSVRHKLTAEDRQKAVSPESRAKRRATLAQRRAERAEAVLWLRHERRFVPEAIADYLGISDQQVKTYLREAKTSRRRR